MYAIREIADIENNTIQILMPSDFPSKKAEIIIFPINNEQKSLQKIKPELPELISIGKKDYASQIILEGRR
jgi:hypothetical protein